MNEDDWEKIIPIWEDLIENVDEDDIQIETNIEEDDDYRSQDGDKSVLSISSNSCLASKKQLRLDKELEASGFSKNDSMRASELHYFDSKPTDAGIETVQEEEEEENAATGEQAETDANNLISESDEYDGAISDKEDDDSNDGQGEVRVYRDKIKNDDEQSISNFSTASRVQSYAQAEAIARERVRYHMNEKKKAKMRKGAYRSRNNNKTFDKGKRGFQDFSI